MKRQILFASLVLSILMFAMGHVVVFMTSMISIALDVPGPYTKEPIAWLWLALHISILFGVSWLFCRWLAKRIERNNAIEKTFG